jgi:prevent-host-death family protein
MRTVDARVAAQSLGRLVDQVRDSGESVMISTPGGAKAILMPVDEFDSLQETLHALMQPNILEELAQGDRDYAAGRTISGDELGKRYGLPDRQRKRQGSRDKGQP